MSARRTIRPLAVIDDPTESTRLLPISKAHYFWRAKTNSSRIGLLRSSPWQMMPFPKRFSSFPILVWTRGPIPGCETSLEQVRSLFTLSSFSRIIIYMEVRVAVSPCGVAHNRMRRSQREIERSKRPFGTWDEIFASWNLSNLPVRRREVEEGVRECRGGTRGAKNSISTLINEFYPDCIWYMF